MSQKCTAPITEPRDSDSILISSPFSLYGFRICLDVPYFLPLLPDRSSFGVSSGYQGPPTLVNPRMSGHEIKPFRFVSPMLANSFTQSSVKHTSRFLLLGLVPVLVVHIPGRNYVGGWIPTSPRASSTLFFFFFNVMWYQSNPDQQKDCAGKTVDAERCKNGKCTLSQ